MKEKNLVEEVTYSNYLSFRDALKKLGIEVSITSGYRSLEEQRKTIEEMKEVYKDEIELYKKVAPVGTSEYHYAYEPWHFRYVGKEVAKTIMNKNITLEEYLSSKKIDY